MLAYISTFYADGTPAVCDVAVRSGYEDLAKFKTNPLGAGKMQVRIPKSQAGFERKPLRVIARDSKGRQGTFEDTIELDRDGDSIQLSTDKTIYKPGEPINIDLVSTLQKSVAYLDVVRDNNVIDTEIVHLDGGKASVSIPYQSEFGGDLTVAVYTDLTEHYWDDRLRSSKGIIYPKQQNLVLKTKFSGSTFHPGQDANVKFSVLDGSGHSAESALGVVIFDKAVEQRARTDEQFGSYFDRFSNLLGYDRAFGALSLKDLNDLDLSKDISPATELGAEIMLCGSYYRPRVFKDEDSPSPSSVYSEFFKTQLGPVGDMVRKSVDAGSAFPLDTASFARIAEKHAMDFTALKDPWGAKYDIRFNAEQKMGEMTFVSPGPDKRSGTDDDIAAFSISGSYFAPVGRKIDDAILKYTATGRFIRDRQTLLQEVASSGLDLGNLRDPWGHPYRVNVDVAGRYYRTTVYSDGPDQSQKWDDFLVWANNVDHFADSERRINDVLSNEVNIRKTPFPASIEEFSALLKRNGIDLDTIKDGFGEPVTLTMDVKDRYVDQVSYDHGKQIIKPASDKLRVFTVNGRDSSGPSAVLTTFSSTITATYANSTLGKIDITNTYYTGAKGAIRGTVKDANGAVVPSVPITAVDQDDENLIFKTESNSEGEFILENIPPGRYQIITAATSGFSAYRSNDIQVRSQVLTTVDITLSTTVGATVDVIASSDGLSVDQSSTKVETTITSKVVPQNFGFMGAQKKSTPRLREYFPETLVWQPELLTDKKGQAEMTFKMADNITTWKMYVIASNKNGKVGVAEKEVTAFQPFFVDLDPPKFLTVGDEVWLPSQVRNYTDKKQQVDVTMAGAAWFDTLGHAKQALSVDAGSSQNAVFGFKTTTAVKDGKQRLTAIAQTDSDAIEKPVTVRPNGDEIVRTDSRIFNSQTSFNTDFPANALSGTQRATLKVYPNLFAHVTEAVEGMLERPYGCGEQTISSTYPNLMILKFIDQDTPLTQKARKYLRSGYERLLGYQAADGGFTYWGPKGDADIALTAYAVRFLTDAKAKIDVDDQVIERAGTWLIKQQRSDGSWTKRYSWENTDDDKRAKVITTYVARSLAMSGGDITAMDKALRYLAARNAEIDEPYALALFGLASLDAGDGATASKIAKQLETMALDEDGGAYWNLETNTPFYGWGTAGRVETTALVLQLLIREGRVSGGASARREGLVSKGILFLLKNKDRYGVWLSTQATISVLDALLAALEGRKANEAQNIQISLNGELFTTLNVPADQVEPVEIDLAAKLSPSANAVEVKSQASTPVMAQIVATHYIDWADSAAAARTSGQSRSLRLDYHCDKTAATMMEDVNCTVEAERIGFRGYGMLLAEIGLPPGADVSRESLEKATETDWSVSHYDVLPDRIVLYMWSRAGGTKINFKFRPRYGINAQTPASLVYDYYNPEAQAVQPPLRFVVK